jgi:transcriptional regulator with XRE-family HTH domain
VGTILANTRTPEVLREIGARIRRVRLDRNETTEALARTAGVGVNTVRRLEAGESVAMRSFIRVMRALGRLQAIDAFLPAPEISPLEVTRMGKARQRASGSTDG